MLHSLLMLVNFLSNNHDTIHILNIHIKPQKSI